MSVSRPPTATGAKGRIAGALHAAGLTSAGVAVLSGAGLAWLFGYLIAGRALYLLAYGALAAVAGGWLAGRRSGRLRVERAPLPERVSEGDQMEVAARVVGRVGGGTVLVDRLPAALGGDRVLSAGDGGRWGYRVTAARRGAWSVGPVVARRADPAGLSEHSFVVGDAVEVLVHPGVEPLGDRPLARLLEDPPVRPPRPRPWRSGLEFAGAQPYTPGDDLRRVLWRAYARTGQLLVREAEQGVTDNVVIVVSTDGKVHTGGDPSVSFEAGVRAAASLGVGHLAEGFAVTLAAGTTALGPLRGRATAVVLLDALARLRTGGRPLAATLDDVMATTGRDAHVVVVTPALAPADLARLDLLVAAGRSVLVVALAYDDEHLEGLAQAPVAGCQLVEVRSGERLSVAFARHHLGALR